ncbi:DUF5671 domain-containing protein [Chloroflexi bacterium]|nr:DUF5671 domain-containing protein [Chloroflexota bacterium]
MNDAISILIFLPLVVLINVCIYKLISSGIGTYRHRALSTNARQLYLYVICGVGLSMLINGLEQSLINLTNLLVSNSLVQTSPDGAALGISLLIIGTPLWFFYWVKINKEMLENSDELSSGIRSAYFLLVLSVSFAISISCFSEIVRESKFDWSQVTTLSIWTLAWFYHAKILVKDRPFNNKGNQSLRNTFVYSFSLVGLFVLASNLASLVYLAISKMVKIEVNSQEILFSDANLATLNLAISIFLGFVVWFTHWGILRNKLTKREYESIYLYVIFIVAATASLVSTIILLMTILGLVLQSDTTGRWILTFSSSTVSFFIAVSILIFHTKDFQNTYLITRFNKTSNEVLIFSLGFLSLGILASGFSVLIHSLLISIIQITWTELIQPKEFWKEPLSLGISLSIVGGLVWYFCWSRLGSISNGFKEDLTYSRVYFLAVIGIAIIFTAGTMAAAMFTLIKGLLSSNLGLQTIQSLITPLSIGIVVSAAGMYHLKIFRNLPHIPANTGNTKRAKVEPAKKTITIISQKNNDSLIDALQTRLGYSANEIIWTEDSNINENQIQPNLDDLYNSIMDSNDQNLILFQDGDNYRIYPYKRTSLEG